GATEKSDFDVFRKAMKAEKPALALDAIEGRVPFDCLVYTGNGARDHCIEPAPDLALPARHRSDVRPYRRIAIGFCNLRIAAREQHRLSLFARLRLRDHLARLCSVRSPSRRHLLLSALPSHRRRLRELLSSHPVVLSRLARPQTIASHARSRVVRERETIFEIRLDRYSLCVSVTTG